LTCLLHLHVAKKWPTLLLNAEYVLKSGKGNIWKKVSEYLENELTEQQRSIQEEMEYYMER
jgi:hypothetical protein